MKSITANTLLLTDWKNAFFAWYYRTNYKIYNIFDKTYDDNNNLISCCEIINGTKTNYFIFKYINDKCDKVIINNIEQYYFTYQEINNLVFLHSSKTTDILSVIRHNNDVIVNVDYNKFYYDKIIDDIYELIKIKYYETNVPESQKIYFKSSISGYSICKVKLHRATNIIVTENNIMIRKTNITKHSQALFNSFEGIINIHYIQKRNTYCNDKTNDNKIISNNSINTIKTINNHVLVKRIDLNFKNDKIINMKINNSKYNYED